MKIFFIFLILVSCTGKEHHREWAVIKTSRSLRVLTLNSSSFYYKNKDDQLEGFEFELINQFAKDHDVVPQFIIKDSMKEILESLKNGEADIAAAGVTITERRKDYLKFTPPYFKIHQVLSCKSKVKVKTLKDLEKLQIITSKNTSHSERLEIVKKIYSGIKWKEYENTTAETLLHKIWKDDKLCTIADSNILDLHRRYMPELNATFKFKKNDLIAWAINDDSDKLHKVLTKWFKKKETKSHVTELKRKYFDFIDFDPYNVKTYIDRIVKRLPKFEAKFKEAGKKYNLPWELLAAVGYQESYWNPNAKSPTGVRGLMMLTRRTAKEVGVKNRLDPFESIEGGAKYLRKIINMLPHYLYEDDKVWFALASYNVGFYHVRDALALTIMQNEDPTRWHSVETVLPLIAHRKYYKRLPYGHARGLEPVLYVNRIKDFYDILLKKDKYLAPIKVYK